MITRLINKKVTITRGANKGKTGKVFLEKGDRLYITDINTHKQINKKKQVNRVRNCYIHRSNVTVNKVKISKL